MIEYTQGKRYALRFNNFLYRDIVHDAYVHWFDKTGKSLFDEPNPTVCRVIKLTYYGYYITKNIRSRHWVEFDDHSFTSTTPEQQLIESQEFELVLDQIRQDYPRTAENMVTSLKMKMDGYEQQEIAEHLGLKKSIITYYFNNLRSMQDLVNSPFSGNKLKVKRITRSEYNKHPEKYEDFTYDTDRWADANEYFTQLVHKSELHGILIVEAKTIDL